MAQRYIKGGIFRKVEYKKSGDGWHFELNWEPLEKQIHETQIKLDTKVWDDMQKYMPYDSHELINSTNALNVACAGEGKVYKYDPLSDYGHYQYEGKVYVDPITGKGAMTIFDSDGNFIGFRSRAGVEKVESNRLLQYTNPSARRHWDEVAIQNHRKEWEKLVLEELNK